jgi:hypothetical protein
MYSSITPRRTSAICLFWLLTFSFSHRGGARGRQSFHPLDLHQAQAAGTECLELLGGAELGNLHIGERGGAHHRSPRRHRHFTAVDGESHQRGAVPLRGTVILLGHR